VRLIRECINCLQVEQAIETEKKYKRPLARTLCGNLAVLGLHGAIGYDNNNMILASHDHLFQVHFLSYDVTASELEELVTREMRKTTSEK
jgi:hypothetical protein